MIRRLISMQENTADIHRYLKKEKMALHVNLNKKATYTAQPINCQVRGKSLTPEVSNKDSVQLLK